jgi:hypothetical protein
MSNRAFVLGLATALGLTACVVDGGSNELVVANRSDFVLEEVHLAEVNDPTWGPNLLPDVLFPGEDLVIVDISCGSYDVLIVDEFGTSCELIDNDLCFNDTDRWTITNTTLGFCAFAKRAPDAPAAPAPEAEQTQL